MGAGDLWKEERVSGAGRGVRRLGWVGPVRGSDLGREMKSIRNREGKRLGISRDKYRD